MKRTLIVIALLALGLGLFPPVGARAQLVVNAGFDMIGFIQKATVAQVGTTAVPRRLRGGTLTINGIEMIVPDNTIVQMPAASFSWADLFGKRNSTPVGNYTPARPVPPQGRTGLALLDRNKFHFPSFEVRVVGNIVKNTTTGAEQYIVGLIVPMAQQGLNAGSGYVNFIDYTGGVLGGIPGRFRVGGVIGDSTTGTLCELNDPFGRFGDAHSPDPRFTVDWNNPTVTAASGYPVCIPRVPLGSATEDADCPESNRPLNNAASVDPNQPFDPFLAAGAPLKTFTMPTPGTAPGQTVPDPFRMVPIMVGDWVDFSGTLMMIDPTAPAGAVPARHDPANMFVSVHTLTAHLGVKTQPGTQPAYTRVEEFLFGVGDSAGGPTVAVGGNAIAQETSTRVALVAFTTDADPTGANLPGGAIFGISVDPTTGAETEIGFPNGNSVDSPVTARDPFEMDDPIRGRIRWNPAKNPRPPVAGLLGNAAGPGNFYREYVFKLIGTGRGQLQLPAQANGLPGLIAGQYRLPIFDYIFGEGTNFGEPIPPFNFNNFGFLTQGSGLLDGTTGPVVGPLNPFPTFQ